MNKQKADRNFIKNFDDNQLFTLMVECFADGNVCYIEKSYMSAHLLLNLLNELRTSNTIGGISRLLSNIYKELITSIIFGHEC